MTTTTDNDLHFASSPSRDIVTGFVPAEKPRQKPRKKRSKLMRIDDMLASSSSSISKPKYGRRPDPTAPKITRPCSECGKKFWSWKALFGHMRCHPERQWRGINPPPNFRRSVSPVKVGNALEGVIMSEEDHEVAACLLMLANGMSTSTSTEMQIVQYVGMNDNHQVVVQELDQGDEACRFECSSCKKVFGSHQALGGHRASHKNVKGCFAITKSDGEVEEQSGGAAVVGSGCGGGDEGVVEDKMGLGLGGHKCSICMRVFSSGQALGGHKRCHWEKGDEAMLSPCGTKEGNSGLDLNLPAPLEDNSSSNCFSSSSGFTLDLRLGL